MYNKVCNIAMFAVGDLMNIVLYIMSRYDSGICTEFVKLQLYVSYITLLIEYVLTVPWFSKIYSHTSFLNPKISGFSVAVMARVHVAVAVVFNAHTLGGQFH